jgi:hypothetical protein
MTGLQWWWGHPWPKRPLALQRSPSVGDAWLPTAQVELFSGMKQRATAVCCTYHYDRKTAQVAELRHRTPQARGGRGPGRPAQSDRARRLPLRGHGRGQGLGRSSEDGDDAGSRSSTIAPRASARTTQRSPSRPAQPVRRPPKRHSASSRRRGQRRASGPPSASRRSADAPLEGPGARQDRGQPKGPSPILWHSSTAARQYRCKCSAQTG